MKVLYVYSGSRRDKFQGTPGVDFADTQFYGWNHLKALGIDAEYLERNPFLPGSIGFRFGHFLNFFKTRKYDIVFGSSLLYMMVLKKLFRSKAKYVLLNIGLIRTLRGNEKRPLKQRIIISLMKEIDGIVCLATVQKNWLESQHPFLKGKVYFVPLGVDTDFYKAVYDARANGAGDARHFVLSVGRDNGRDYRTLIEAARILPETKFEIVCSRRNVEGIAHIPTNVEIHYDLPQRELISQYKKAGMMVISTYGDSHTDGSDCSGQTVLLDAMACGVPVIVTEKAYLADYVKGTALIIPPNDSAGMAEAIKKTGSLGKAVSADARRDAEERFSTRTMARALVQVFTAVLH